MKPEEKNSSSYIPFVDIHKDDKYKKIIISEFCFGIENDEGEFSKLLEYVIDNKYELFDIPEFKKGIFEEDDKVMDLVLPSIRRLYGKMFINPPSLFMDSNNNPTIRYTLFTLYFNIDDFIDYFISSFKKNKKCLKNFEYLDRTSETLTLIVDNYISMLVKKVNESENYSEDIKKILKSKNRGKNIDKILKNKN